MGRSGAFITAHRVAATILYCALVLSARLLIPLLSGATPNRDEESALPYRNILGSILQSPISLQEGIGVIHEHVTTPSAQAQAFCNQGVSLLYSYDWIHAGRSFHEALRRDPNLASAYVGLSYVYSGFADNMRAREMAEKANQIGGRLTPTEGLRIKVRLQELKAAEPQPGARMPPSVLTDLDDALKKEPKNVNLLLIRGVASEGYAGAIGQRGGNQSIPYYERVLALDPDNAPAHHFLVHANEMVGNIAEAIKHGEAYQQLAPAVAHAHHMYGHDLRRTERLKDAITQFELADDITRKNYRGEPRTLLYDWNYRHNLNLLAATYAQAGLLPAANRTFKKLSELDSITPADDLYKAQYAVFLLRENRSKEAVATAMFLGESQFDVGRLLGIMLSGSAFARLHSATKASDQLLAAEKQFQNLAPEWRVQVGPRMEILRAQVDFLTGDGEEGAARLKTLILGIRSRPGSDAWSDLIFYLDLIAQIATEAGQWDFAKWVATQLENSAPFYYRAHELLARIAQHDGDQVAATRESELARKYTLE